MWQQDILQYSSEDIEHDDMAVDMCVKSKDMSSFGVIVIFMCIGCMLILIISSLYLLVFRDDRVRDTREQMIL